MIEARPTTETKVTRPVVTPLGINALVLDPDPNRLAATKRMLARLGYCVVGSGARLAEVDAERLQSEVGVVVIGEAGTTELLIDQVKSLRYQNNVPVLVLSEDANTDQINQAVNAGVNAYVLIGVNGNRIKAGIDLALANHKVVSELESSLQAMQEALDARKIIERAKGIIMKTKGLDEASAYEMLRKSAMKRGVKLVDVARTLTDAEDLLE